MANNGIAIIGFYENKHNFQSLVILQQVLLSNIFNRYAIKAIPFHIFKAIFNPLKSFRNLFEIVVTKSIETNNKICLVHLKMIYYWACCFASASWNSKLLLSFELTILLIVHFFWEKFNLNLWKDKMNLLTYCKRMVPPIGLTKIRLQIFRCPT